MPKIISYTPAWLSKPAPGHEILSVASSRPPIGDPAVSRSINSVAKFNGKPGPRRTIARRGTEVFVAVGKEIRWADLIALKEEFEEDPRRETARQTPSATSRETSRSRFQDDESVEDDAERAHGYRVCYARTSSRPKC